MPRPRIKENGRPGELEIFWSPLEVAVVVLLLSVGIGFGSWVAITQIALGREIGEVSGELRSLKNELDVRATKAQEEHEHFMTREEFQAWVEGGRR